jgi:hypothetical protein
MPLWPGNDDGMAHGNDLSHGFMPTRTQCSQGRPDRSVSLRLRQEIQAVLRRRAKVN